MCRIILANGYQTSAVDVDQPFSEVLDRITKSKNGFVYLTQEGSGRLFSFTMIGYVVEESKPAAIDSEESITQTESTEDTGALHTPQTPISPVNLPSIQQ